MTNPTTKLAAMLPRGLAEHLPADDHLPEAAWLAALCTSGKDWESARVVRLLRTIANRKDLGGLGKAWLTRYASKTPSVTDTEALEAELAEKLDSLANALENSEGRHAAVNNAETPAHVDGVLLFDHRLAEFAEKLGDKGKAYAKQVRVKSRKFTEGKIETLDLMRKSAEAWLDAIEKLRLNDGEVWTQSATFLGTSSGILTGLGLGMGPVSRDFELAPLLEAWLPTRAEAGHVILPLRVRELAAVVWQDVVQPRLERAARLRPSLVRAIHLEATLFHSRGPRFDEQNPNALTFQGRQIAERMGAAFDLDVIQRGLGLLGSVASHELFHWEVNQGYEQAILNRSQPHVIDVEGGWVALAERLGLKPSKHAANLRSLVITQASYRFHLPDGSRGNMLVLNERAAIGGRRAHVRIELGTILMPHYVYDARIPRRERKLVPLLRERVPLFGRANEHGEQRTMSLAVMGELRDRATELVTDGGALLTDNDFTRMADRAGLPRRLIQPVVKHWIEGDSHAPAFLKVIARGRYTLSDVHIVERDFLEEGGRRELVGVKGGTKGVVKREKKLKRIGG